MEAKDTVIKNEDIMDLDIPCESCAYAPIGDSPTAKCLECMGLRHREAQADISFPLGKAEGIRGVVELIAKDTNNFELPISLGCIAKLKEWEI